MYGNREKSLKISHFGLRRCHAISDLSFEKFFSTAFASFDYFLFHFNLIIYPPAISPLFLKFREGTQGMAGLTRREVEHAVRDPFQKLTFFLSSSLD